MQSVTRLITPNHKRDRQRALARSFCRVEGKRNAPLPLRLTKHLAKMRDFRRSAFHLMPHGSADLAPTAVLT